MRKLGTERQADVLSVLKRHEKPLTAYEILGELRDDEAALAPPTIYRALAALTEQGRAHRLESLNAFVPCRCDHDDLTPILTVCGDCGSVEEFQDRGVIDRIGALAAGAGFSVSRHVLEMHGRCAGCAA